MALVLHKLGRDTEAKIYEDQAARIRAANARQPGNTIDSQAPPQARPDEKPVDSNDLAEVNRLNDQASLYKSQGKYAEAEPALPAGLAINEKALGPDHLEVATSLNKPGGAVRLARQACRG